MVRNPLVVTVDTRNWCVQQEDDILKDSASCVTVQLSTKTTGFDMTSVRINTSTGIINLDERNAKMDGYFLDL